MLFDAATRQYLKFWESDSKKEMKRKKEKKAQITWLVN